MLYWLGVYALVAGVVLVPFLLLYVVALLSSLALTATRFMIQSLKSLWPIRIEFSREHWSMIRR
jgi:hypothetical protein